MTLSADHGARQEHTRWTSSEARKHAGFLAIPLKVLRDHGPASKSLAGILSVLRMDGRRTCRRQAAIAKMIGVSIRTFRRHCRTLELAGIIKVGRRQDDTSIISLVKTEADLMSDGFLAMPRYVLPQSWSESVVYSWIVYRAQLSSDESTVEDSFGRISVATGLSRRSIFNAVDGLVAKGYIKRESHLEGQNGRFELLLPPCLNSQNGGSANVSAPRTGGANVSAGIGQQVVQMCPQGGANVSDSNRRDHKSYGPKKTVDQKLIRVEVLAPGAGRLFKAIGYHGKEGRNVWKIAGAAELGLITEHELADSIAGCHECSPKNRPAYLFAILRSHLAKRSIDITKMLRTVIVTPNCPTSPPDRTNQKKTVSPDGSDRTNGPTSMSSLMEKWRDSDAA